MREAYRKKGWAFKDADTIEQCKREGWSEKIQAQKNEGCRAFGYLEVNKVCVCVCVYVCVFVWEHLCVCVYEGERERDRDREREWY